MTIIAPSILAADFMNLEQEVSYFKDSKDVWLHLDVMDGHFVPNLTFGTSIIKQLSNITDLPLDVHLMVANPEFHVEEMKEFGLHNVTIHVESTKGPLELLKIMRQYYKSIGISIKPKTPVSELSLEILKMCDLVLVMSVEPGFGGQSFMDSSLIKIKELVNIRKDHNLDFQIQIDGGINQETSKLSIDAGVDNMVAGSYIFRNDSAQYINKLETLR